MGRKRVQRTKPSSPLLTVADDGRRDGDGDVNGERNLSVSVMAVEDIEQMNLENEVRLSIESEGYGAVKVDCEKALKEIRRGNHTKAIKLMKDLCGKYENPAYLALVYRVQGTVCVKVATIIDDPNAKQRHLKNAIESAKKAVMLSPGSVEFAHFYANLIYETASDGKDYEDSVRECERALAIKNPIDPGKESLQDESQQKISAADARIANVQSELRALLQKANLGTISSWMRNLGHGEDKLRIIPIRRVPEDPMDVRVVQGRRPNDIKKANKKDEERKKEIEVKVAAARLLQQKQELALTQPEANKALEPSSGTGPQTGERRKSGKVKKNTSDDERKEAVLRSWKSMSSDLKKGLFEIKISDFKSHFKSLKDGLQYDEVINEALSFGVDNNSWRFWMCCRCSEKFADPELHKHHVLHAHTQSLSPELQAVLPPNVDSEWTEMLLTFPWKALDVHESVKMIKSQSSIEEKKYEESCKTYSNPNSWPLSDDSERMKLLGKIKVLFQLLIRCKCLAASHLTKVIQFAVDELHPQLLNSGVEQSPICICFLGATELKKVSMFLQELSRSCDTEKGMEELKGVTQVSEIAEKIVIDKDGSSLLLDKLSLPCEDNIGSEKRLAVDDDSLLSWIFSGPTSREQLTFWTRGREEKVHQGVELLDTLGKEFAHLQSLCERKMEHISYEEAVQLVEDLCLEEGKRRENSTEFVRQSYESVLRKRLHDISKSDSEVTPVNKFEAEVLTNVLKEADSFAASQFGYGSVNSQICDLESDTCIEVGIQKQKEHLSVELSNIDARIMRNVSRIKQLEAKIGPLCAHDFGLIVVPLVKSYLRAHIENLAYKDATEKSDVAREAFLAELDLDSKKGTGDISKHSNGKLKDKRKNKEHRKSKDSRITGDLHVSSHDNVSKASSTPPEIDEQPRDSDAETGAVLHQQEDEARRRKMELEAEERRIEDVAKQRHLAEQLKSSSRVTPTGNPVDDEWEPSRLEPIKQNNGALSPPEDGLCNAKDGFPKRTGLLDGRQQSVSSGKETTEFGQGTFSDRLQDTSSGDNGAVPLRLLQAEDDDDDEKRFQADPSNIQDVIINPDQQNVELEVKEVGEIGKSQNAQKSFSSQASGFGFEMGKDCHLDGSDESRAMGSTLGGQDEVQDASVDLPSESAIPATVDSPAGDAIISQLHSMQGISAHSLAVSVPSSDPGSFSRQPSSSSLAEGSMLKESPAPITESPPVVASPTLSRKHSDLQSPISVPESSEPKIVPVDRQAETADLVTDSNKVLKEDGTMFKHPTLLVTPAELMATSSTEINHVTEQKSEVDSNVQDVIMNPDQQNVELEVKEVGEIGKSQNVGGYISEQKEKSFSSQASGFGFEMGKDRHLDGSNLGRQDEVQDANVDLPSESAIPATIDSPASVSSTKGKKHKGTNDQESTPSSPPSQSVYNSTDSHNEAGVGSSVPSGDAILSQLHSMQEIIDQVLSNQKEIQKQIPTMVANTITKEGRKIEAAIGKSMEKSYKANSDAVWARTQEEFAKQEKSNRDRNQQVSALVTNGYKDLLATFEKMLKKETSALVASVVRSITPIIEKTVSTAITEAFQRGVADKSVNQLEKSVNSKLEGSIARQIQTQFQTSGKQALQEALKSSMEASVVPAFEMSCKAMFDQVNATFQKGMIEHTSAAHQQVESAHSPLAIALRDAINSASSVTQSLSGELADGQRKLVALALAGANSESVNPLVTQISNGPIGSFHDKMEAPLDPTKELSRLVYEHKYEEAFTAALQRSDVWIVSWLCSQVDLQGLLTSNPLPLSQGVLLSLLQQLACDIGNDTSKKLAWMMDVVVAIKPSDSMIAMHVRPIFEQVKSILNHQVSIPTTSVAERSSIKIVMKLISSTLGTL